MPGFNFSWHAIRKKGIKGIRGHGLRMWWGLGRCTAEREGGSGGGGTSSRRVSPGSRISGNHMTHPAQLGLGLSPQTYCRTLLFACAASAWEGMTAETPVGAEVHRQSWASWEDVRHQREGGASEGRGQEALCLKLYGEPLENFKQGDNLLVVRFEAGHLIFPILHYLGGIMLFPPTGEPGNSQVRLLVIEK